MQTENVVTISTNGCNKQILQPLQQVLYQQPLTINQQPLLLTQQYPDTKSSIMIEKQYPQQALIEHICPQKLVAENTYSKIFHLNNLLPSQPINVEDVYSQPTIRLQVQQYPRPALAEQVPVASANLFSKPLIIEKQAMVQPYAIEQKLMQPMQKQVYVEQRPQRQPIFIRQEVPQIKLTEQVCPKQNTLVEEIRPIFLAAQPAVSIQPQAVNQQIKIEKENDVEAKSGSSTVTLLNFAGIPPSAQPMVETVVAEPEPVEQLGSVLFYQPRSYLMQPQLIRQRHY